MKSLIKMLQFGALAMLLLVVASALFPAEAMAAAQALPYGADLFAFVVGNPTGLIIANVCLPIADIVEDECGSNPGGTVDLYVIRKRDIQEFPAVGEDGVTLSGPIVPKNGKGFVKWDHVLDTGELNHKSEGDIGNQSVSQDSAVYIPRGNPAIDSVITAALNGEFVIIQRDSKGQLRVGGNKLRGLKFDYDYKSGKAGTDKNGTDFKFSGKGFGQAPYYYTAAIPLLGGATVPAQG